MDSGGELLTLMLVVAGRRRYDDNISDGRALRCSLWGTERQLGRIIE